MRILIVTHAPLNANYGASQVAINLGEALRALGQDVTLWSPQPLPPTTRWWQTLSKMRAKLDGFLKTQEPFEVIDCPATFITRRVSASAPVIARNNQPDILYLAYSLRTPTANIKTLGLLPLEFAHTLFHLCLVLQGWRRARYILCHGSLELQLMRRWFPSWRHKLSSYLCALSTADQHALASVRSQRKARSAETLRFLWIGRWAAHKGPDILLDFISKWATPRPQDTFTIAGCGEAPQKDCPAALLQSGRIKIVPSFERRDLYSLLAEHDIGLFTSKVEGWGLALNEMLEAGMPVFATPAGGTKDLQPFFKTLLPFPPSVNLSVIPTDCEIPSTYYDTFSWSRIAQGYIDLADSLTTARRLGSSARHGRSSQPQDII